MTYPYPAGLRLDVDTYNESAVQREATATVSYSVASDAGAIGTSETVVCTLASATFLASTIYSVEVYGGYNMSTGSAYPYWKLRKTDASGTILCDFQRSQSPGASGLAFGINGMKEHFIVGGSDVTAVLVLTVFASSGTITMVGNSQRRRRVIIRPYGGTNTDIPDLTELT